MNSVTPARNSASSNSVAPRKLKRVRQILPDQIAENAAGVERQTPPVAEVQRRQAAAGGHGQEESRPAHRQHMQRDLVVAAVAGRVHDQPAAVADHHWKQIGEIAEQIEQHIGEPGADHATTVADLVHRTRVRPAGIARVIRGQRQQHVGGHGDRVSHKAPSRNPLLTWAR